MGGGEGKDRCMGSNRWGYGNKKVRTRRNKDEGISEEHRNGDQLPRAMCTQNFFFFLIHSKQFPQSVQIPRVSSHNNDHNHEGVNRERGRGLGGER